MIGLSTIFIILGGCMNRELNLSIVLQRELLEYSIRIKEMFWDSLCSELLRKFDYQNNFYLIGGKPSREEVIARFRTVALEQCQKYGLEFSEESLPMRIELKISFYYNDIYKTLFNEVAIVVYKNEIDLRIMPNGSIFRMFSLEEASTVEKMLISLLADLFVEKKDYFNQIQDEYLKIREDSSTLTPKTIEIAKNSIKTIYDKYPQKNKHLLQRNLYSEMTIKEKKIWIFHSDFLKNPNVLLKELQ